MIFDMTRRSSGGGGDTYAFIVAIYPVGSTCTATNGSTTLTAGDTSGRWAFGIPEVGTWTISATDGTDTAEEAVVITALGQIESVALLFGTYLVRNGSLQSAESFDRATASASGNYRKYTSAGNYYCAAILGPVNGANRSKVILDLGPNSYTYYNSSMVPSIGISRTIPSVTQSTGNLSPYINYERLITPGDAGGATDVPEGQYVFDFSDSGTFYVWLLWAGQSGRNNSLYVRNLYVT